ncbi:MFS transporter [Bacillus horti]|uniref:MFS family permease n=1 Tax=Caldalkalibacillus horti TaxID=77523 RepID=A0ABT9VY19_9BACI|nr:MFS transporter [Bacillus horti]MDQ0165893.1 MFS family permease [Bacillus horti]
MKKLMYVIVAISFLDMFVQFPIMSPLALSLGASSATIGLVMGSYSFTNLFGNVLAGIWVDRYGAKKIFVLGMLSTAFVILLYIWVSTPFQLIIVRLLHGLISGLLTPSIFTWVSQMRKEDQNLQGKNMAFSGAAVGVAAVLGPAFSSLIMAGIGIHAVFYFMSILLLITGIICALFIRGRQNNPRSRTLHHSSQTDEQKNEWKVLTSYLPGLVLPYIGSFSLMCVMGVLTYMLPIKVQELGLDIKTGGLMLSTFGFVAVLFFVLPSNRIFDRFSLNTILITGFIFLTAALWMLYFFSQEVLLYMAMGVYGLGFACIFPAITKQLVEHIPDEVRGKAFGLFYAIFSIGVVVGSVLVGMLTTSVDDGFKLAAMSLTVLCPVLLILTKQIPSKIAVKA